MAHMPIQQEITSRIERSRGRKMCKKIGGAMMGCCGTAPFFPPVKIQMTPFDGHFFSVISTATTTEPCSLVVPTCLLVGTGHLGTRGREFQSDERQSREAEREGVRLVKMKLSSKTMSSPGRTEKFPPPLMRFLRSNVGSRSRGRSRSSPMFVRKKNTAIETQEPSSPKVTCIGQVRVRRSKQGSGKATKARKKTRGWCRWIRNALCCNHFVGRLKPKPFRPVWRKSAPYRSSSLASRFWGSPLATEEEQKTEPENTDQQNPASENEPSSRDSAAESRTDPETDRDSEYLNQSEDSTSERSTKPTKTEAFKTGEEATAHPLILTRCKSEPARTGARLNPDTTLFWKKRSPTVQAISPQ
ncbi:hypothetical protein CK203_074606 [Vitis vinifera]|uniref:Uncharacterized protein n=1 Tax=Vitis vinifera TaxID=29760 RepID=A0A438DWF2_VITVI|nr:hypothetical protein CK203_074606 [Vitis vinifera]